MANLAIQGHKTRGKKVIEILEMLGGKNIVRNSGKYNNLWYYINVHGEITFNHIVDSNKYIFFTLEEFLEKFPYKIGDKVIDIKTNRIVEIYKAHWSESNNCTYYDVKLCNNTDYVRSYKFLQFYKEEIMKEDKGTLVEIDLTREFKKSR